MLKSRMKSYIYTTVFSKIIFLAKQIYLSTTKKTQLQIFFQTHCTPPLGTSVLSKM